MGDTFIIFQMTSCAGATGSLIVVIKLKLEHSVTSSQSQHQVECGLLLDVVVGEGPAILKLLSGENQSLLVWRDAFLVLDLGLHVFDRVSWLDIQGDGLAGQGLDEDLHAAAQPQHQVERRLLEEEVVVVER